MRARNLIFLLLAVIAAVGTAMLARGWVNAQRSDAVTIAAPAQETPAQFVLVTTQALPAGKLLGKDDVRWQPWPEDGLNQAYIIKGTQDIEAFVGAVVRRSLAPGEPITEGRIALPGERGFLAAMLTPGMRAISVPVNATSGISGLVFPGDRVDLILTHTFSQGTESEPMPRRASETVLRNIRVLAVDQRTDDQDGQPIVAKTATKMMAIRAPLMFRSWSFMARPSRRERPLRRFAPFLSRRRSFTLLAPVPIRLLMGTIVLKNISGGAPRFRASALVVLYILSCMMPRFTVVAIGFISSSTQVSLSIFMPSAGSGSPEEPASF